jgi:hypothetical protein
LKSSVFQQTGFPLSPETQVFSGAVLQGVKSAAHVAGFDGLYSVIQSAAIVQCIAACRYINERK